MADGEIPPYKYDIENTFSAICSYACLAPPSRLSTILDEAPEMPPFPIYLICTRPRIRVVLDSFVCTKDSVHIEFEAEGVDESTVITFEAPNPYGEAFELRASGARTTVELSKGGVVFARLPAANYLSFFLPPDRQTRIEQSAIDEMFLDLEVQYVGQSLDKNGAVERRLLAHEPTQKMLAIAQEETPHLDVWVVLMAFDNAAVVSMMGGWRGTAGPEASLAHLTSAVDVRMPLRDRVALIEAALIRYFQPVHNTDFKHSFPKPLHKTYKHVYEVDFNQAGVEFDTMEILHSRLYSRAVKPSFHHLPHFPLHDRKARREFFNVKGEEDFRHPAVIYPEDRP